VGKGISLYFLFDVNKEQVKPLKPHTTAMFLN